MCWETFVDESTIPQQGDFSFHLSEEFDDIPEVSCTGTDVECSANEASEPPVTKSPDAHNGGKQEFNRISLLSVCGTAN